MNETEFDDSCFKYFEKFTLKDYTSEDYARELHPPKKSRLISIPQNTCKRQSQLHFFSKLIRRTPSPFALRT